MIAERLGPLRSREFRMLFGAQTSSLLGDNILNVAIVFAVLGLRHSPADIGFVLVARNVPMVAFVLIGGVWADRVRRQRLMMTADLAPFAGQALMAALFIPGRAQLREVVLLELAVDYNATLRVEEADGDAITLLVDLPLEGLQH